MVAKNRLSSGPEGICTASTGTLATRLSLSAASIAEYARRNFSMIIVLPLLVGPTSKMLGMRVRWGNASSSSSASMAASARA
jgi:hypothetical protein